MVRIPSEYQEVEYLESTGMQWINTGIPLSRIVDINVNWTLRFALTNLKTQILGGANSFDKQIVVINGCVRRDWASTAPYGSFSPVLSTDAIYEISQRDGYYELTDKNGNIESKEITKYSSHDYPFILFAKSTNTEGTTVENSTIACMKLYSFVVSGETEIANFIPCYRKSDNEPGMYDTVSKQFYTNSGTGTFLKGNDVTYDNINLLESRRRILLNTPHIETVSDTVASFKTDIATKIKGCKIHFTPIQEGEGDPSPENVRPIHGWDGVTVTACGKNLFDKSKRTATRLIDSTGSIVYNASWFVTDFIPLQGTKVSCHGSRRANTTYHAIYDENKQLVSVVKQEKINNLTIPSNARYIRCSCANEYIDAFQVELNSAPTSYEPYTETSITIPFPQTIYGGYVDLVNGEVVEEYRKILIPIDDVRGKQLSGYNGTNTTRRYFMTGSGYSAKSAHSYLISDMFHFSGSNNDSNPWSLFHDGTALITYRVDNTALEITNDMDGATRDSYIKSWLKENAPYVVYELATPNTYPIDPQTLKALRGINNIWSDANGNIEVSFYTH